MDLSSIYLVENLSNYNFEDVVFLAADINSIVEALMQPLVMKETEKTMFLAQVLKTALHICRTVTCNYTTLEELLKMNWSSAENSTQKWTFFEQLTLEDPVQVTARRILLSNQGVLCLGIIQEFYRMYYSKETFKEMLNGVCKLVPASIANHAFQSLKKTMSATGETNAPSHQSNEMNIVTLANHYNAKDFKNCVDKLQEKLNEPDKEELLKAQLHALKMLFSSATLMGRYEEALKSDVYYQLNLTLLKLYHDNLLTNNILYDTNVIMLLYLLRQNGVHDVLLKKEFLNETRLGGHERMRVVLLELQNFS